MEELMIKIDNVKKQYRLGAIGGGTLQGDLQSWWAKVRGKEDPNSKIGTKIYKKNEKFMALDGVSFDVKPGERVGIIGHNGAGKSTLLKILSRVTAPTEGQICLNGRVTSMLEVGTGFHGELTGRENIYMNGAILGMTKAEIDSKIDEIIEFSECGQFIDTPVKRYSSGMYVKLAFSVAAHLDSEIMIMDEVLAVGDMAFQKKCLEKMNSVSKEQGRTILYVSHNMNTIRQLCNRCVVLEHGKISYMGDCETAIAKYLNRDVGNETEVNYENVPRLPWLGETSVKMLKAGYIGKSNPSFKQGEEIDLHLEWLFEKDVENMNLRIEILKPDRTPIGFTIVKSDFSGQMGQVMRINLKLPNFKLANGDYTTNYLFFEEKSSGEQFVLECVHGLNFKITPSDGVVWHPKAWGDLQFDDSIIMD